MVQIIPSTIPSNQKRNFTVISHMIPSRSNVKINMGREIKLQLITAITMSVIMLSDRIRQETKKNPKIQMPINCIQ